jgi:hypothetical protein
MAKWVVRPPPKGQKKKKTKKTKTKTKNGFWSFGGGRTTPKGLGWLQVFFFFFFLPFWRWPNNPLAMGVVPKSAVGVAGATPDFLIFLSFPFFFLIFQIYGQNNVVLDWVGVVILKPKTV